MTKKLLDEFLARRKHRSAADVLRDSASMRAFEAAAPYRTILDALPSLHSDQQYAPRFMMRMPKVVASETPTEVLARSLDNILRIVKPNG